MPSASPGAAAPDPRCATHPRPHPRPHPAPCDRPATRPSPRASAAFALDASVLVTLLAASSAPTPLYPRYQEQWDLSALTVTVVFSAYALALLLALLTTGALSDHLGRRPVLVTALAAETLAMLLLATADGPDALIAARILQGVATGTATSAAGAALLDLTDPTRPRRSALANTIAPVAGMAAGVLLSTLLTRFAPAPTVTVYLLLAAVFTGQAVAVARAPETADRRHGAWRSLRPHLAVPPSARRTLLRAGPAVAAVWALGGFHSSLGPALVRAIAPHTAPAASGLPLFTLTATAALTTLALRRTAPRTTLEVGCATVVPAAALTLYATHGAGLPALCGGAALAGAAFGAVTQGGLRLTLAALPGHGRTGTLAAYQVLCYLSMSLPAVAAGAATVHHGLTAVAHAHATSTAVLAALSLPLLHRTTKETKDHDHGH
ncbi:MFS transporter [Streptomyces flavalbus]|uniref:MFS transporter n=1 Tax=Streptomyces flavalbus TaxID=2665155 RepID=A0ABW2W3Y8_9ACTN